MHLLLVEDEDAIRSALVRGLASGGNTVDGAASLAEARAKAEAAVEAKTAQSAARRAAANGGGCWSCLGPTSRAS